MQAFEEAVGPQTDEVFFAVLNQFSMKRAPAARWQDATVAREKWDKFFVSVTGTRCSSIADAVAEDVEVQRLRREWDLLLVQPTCPMVQGVRHLPVLPASSDAVALYDATYLDADVKVKRFHFAEHDWQGKTMITEARRASRALREARLITIAQECPQIVRLHGISVTPSTPGPDDLPARVMIIMERCPSSLQDELRRRDEGAPGGWEVDAAWVRQVLTWMLQVARAMLFLHGMRPAVLHRDLKPDNIMLDGSGAIKVCSHISSPSPWPALGRGGTPLVGSRCLTALVQKQCPLRVVINC